MRDAWLRVFVISLEVGNMYTNIKTNESPHMYIYIYTYNIRLYIYSYLRKTITFFLCFTLGSLVDSTRRFNSIQFNDAVQLSESFITLKQPKQFTRSASTTASGGSIPEGATSSTVALA